MDRRRNAHCDSLSLLVEQKKLVLQVCRQCSGPLALTSANLSNDQSTLSVEEFSSLHSSLALVCDDGRLSDSEEARLGSTVVDLSQEGSYSIIRQG